MEKFEQAVSVLMLAMGLVLMREGLSYLSRSEPVAHPITYPAGESLAIVLAGPDGIEKTAQAEFLRQR